MKYFLNFLAGFTATLILCAVLILITAFVLFDLGPLKFWEFWRVGISAGTAMGFIFATSEHIENN